jgi:hypothetical protein
MACLILVRYFNPTKAPMCDGSDHNHLQFEAHNTPPRLITDLIIRKLNLHRMNVIVNVFKTLTKNLFPITFPHDAKFLIFLINIINYIKNLGERNLYSLLLFLWSDSVRESLDYVNFWNRICRCCA